VGRCDPKWIEKGKKFKVLVVDDVMMTSTCTDVAAPEDDMCHADSTFLDADVAGDMDCMD
jgi:hypothetical protein